MADVAPYDNMLTPTYCVGATRLWAGLANPSGEPDVVAASPMPQSILSNPHLNPMAADLGRLAESKTKLIIISGTWDVLHPDIVRFVDKCEEAGIGAQTTYVEGEHMFHVFPLGFKFVPEAQQTAEIIISLVKSL